MHPAPRPLPPYIHRDRHQAHPDVDPTNRDEGLQDPLVLDPGDDEVREAENEDVLDAATEGKRVNAERHERWEIAYLIVAKASGA